MPDTKLTCEGHRAKPGPFVRFNSLSGSQTMILTSQLVTPEVLVLSWRVFQARSATGPPSRM
jgi:hypothetical protein